MEALEFRVSPEGTVFYKEKGKEEKRLTRFNRAVCDFLLQTIKERFPGAWSRLCLLYKPTNDVGYFKVVERFIRCNFGEHDLLTHDIEDKILHFEEVKCPLRGFCKDENVICKPKGLIKLTPAEQRVVQLYLWGYTFREIAEKLEKSAQTVKAQLHNIKKKLGVKNCREIIKVMRCHNI